MGTTGVGAIAGAAIGSFIPGIGWQLGMSLGSTIGGMFDKKSGSLGDTRVSGSSYGVSLPICYGRVRVPGVLIYSNQLQEHEGSSGGGKGGGGGSSSSSTTTYSATMAYAFAVGVAGASLSRLYANDLIWWESSSSSDQTSTYCNDDANCASDNGLSLNEFEQMSSSTQAQYRQACQARHNTQSTLINGSKVHFYDGNESQSVDSAIAGVVGGGISPAYRGTCYVALDDADLSSVGNARPMVSAEIDFPITTLGGIFADICSRAGIPSAYYNFAAATDTVTGYMISDRTDAISAMSPLLSAYLYDLVEVDGILTAIKRGSAAVCEIPMTAMGAKSVGMGGDDKPEIRLSQPRETDFDLPAILDVSYYDYGRHCQQGVATARRITADPTHVNVKSVDIAITTDSTTARTFAERLLSAEWTERDTAESSVDYGYAYLAPADIITDDNGTRWRVNQIDMGVPDVLKLSLTRDSTATTTVASNGGDANPTTTTGAASVVPSLWQAWSGNELTDSDATSPGFYVAATGGSGWGGCTVYYGVVESNGSVSWIEAGSITAKSVLGASTTALGDASGAGAWDSTNSVGVQTLMGGQLASDTEAAVLAGANWAKLGNEYIGFASASLGANAGRYTLSLMQRELRSTSGTGHAIGDTLILISSALLRVIVPNGLIGETVQVICVSPGQSTSDVAANAQIITITAPNSPYATSTTVTTTVNDALDTLNTEFVVLKSGVSASSVPAGTMGLALEGNFNVYESDGTSWQLKHSYG